MQFLTGMCRLCISTAQCFPELLSPFTKMSKMIITKCLKHMHNKINKRKHFHINNRKLFLGKACFFLSFLNIVLDRREWNLMWGSAVVAISSFKWYVFCYCSLSVSFNQSGYSPRPLSFLPDIPRYSWLQNCHSWGVFFTPFWNRFWNIATGPSGTTNYPTVSTTEITFLPLSEVWHEP